MGIENELSQAEVDAADAAILATDIEIEMEDRFSRVRKIMVPVKDALMDTEAVFAKLLKSGPKWSK